MNTVIISDNESFVQHSDKINNKGYESLGSIFSTGNSNKMYGIHHEHFGWLEHINVNVEDGSTKLKYTFDKEKSLSIRGIHLNGVILTYGQCILK